jgi:hypothetical protein
MSDKLQTQRFERKYFIKESQALQIREFLRHYLEPDEYSKGKPNYSYPIHSIYLDSDLLTTYWAQVHGEKNRFKLRLRFYDDNPESPVFFELKGRVSECILKQRAPIRKDCAALLVAGQYPGLEHLLKPKASDLVAAQNFCRLMQSLQAQPKLHVAYLREAWLPRDDNFLRVTMDREILGAIERSVKLSTKTVETFRPKSLYTPYGKDTVVLELKYTHNFPEWYRDLVHLFNLRQTGMPKYGSLIMNVGEEVVSAPGDWNGAMPRTRW